MRHGNRKKHVYHMILRARTIGQGCVEKIKDDIMDNGLYEAVISEPVTATLTH